MEIRKTKPEELEVLLKMYEHARRFMATHGNASQWENNYPSPQLILDDITEGNSYVCTEQDQIIATSIIKKGLILLICASTMGTGSTTPVTESSTASLPPEM
mgnify:CR=1 FL=1